jgi:hypothetical protein
MGVRELGRSECTATFLYSYNTHTCIIEVAFRAGVKSPIETAREDYGRTPIPCSSPARSTRGRASGLLYLCLAQQPKRQAKPRLQQSARIWQVEQCISMLASA